MATVAMADTNSPVGGFDGLFYGKGGSWTYWQGAQQSYFGCSEYNTRILQQAYEGSVCYDTTTQEPKTVKVSP